LGRIGGVGDLVWDTRPSFCIRVLHLKGDGESTLRPRCKLLNLCIYTLVLFFCKQSRRLLPRRQRLLPPTSSSASSERTGIAAASVTSGCGSSTCSTSQRRIASFIRSMQHAGQRALVRWQARRQIGDVFHFVPCLQIGGCALASVGPTDRREPSRSHRHQMDVRRYSGREFAHAIAHPNSVQAHRYHFP
jgi:hypothetical protein